MGNNFVYQRCDNDNANNINFLFNKKYQSIYFCLKINNNYVIKTIITSKRNNRKPKQTV